MISSNHKLPSWVYSKQRGFFKDELMKELGPQHSISTSWLSTWRPVNESEKVHFSYIKKNNDEIVSKSKAFEINDFPTKKKCIICYKKFMLPTWVCYAYKFKDGITREKIYDCKQVACVYHFHCKGIFNDRKPKYENEYKDTDDFNESEFSDYSEDF